MTEISITEEFLRVCPHFAGAAVTATVCNAPTPPVLWAEMESEVAALRAHFTTDNIKERSGIRATRQAYKAAGKDPSRYRPACEQLARRVLQGKSLYSVDTLVDIGNLVSLRSGYATAALDADKIAGPCLTLGIGRAGEPYEGIGRGALNIDCLPVYRDAEGGVATPTSDNVRTMLSLSTRRLLLLVNGYDGDRHRLAEAADLARRLLCRYAQAADVRVAYYPR